MSAASRLTEHQKAQHSSASERPADFVDSFQQGAPRSSRKNNADLRSDPVIRFLRISRRYLMKS